MDLLGQGPPTADRLEAAVKDVCRTEVPNDGVDFQPDSVEVRSIRPDQEYEGLRAHVEARIGSARIRLQIDVGFGDAVWPAPELEAFPVLLEDFEAPRPRTYLKEAVVAEKFQAMVDLGMANSRMKDFYDLWYLSEHFGLRANPSPKPSGVRSSSDARRSRQRCGDALPGRSPVGLSATVTGNSPDDWRAFDCVLGVRANHRIGSVW